MIDGLDDWLFDWLAVRLIDWLFECLIDRLIDWLTDVVSCSCSWLIWSSPFDRRNIPYLHWPRVIIGPMDVWRSSCCCSINSVWLNRPLWKFLARCSQISSMKTRSKANCGSFTIAINDACNVVKPEWCAGKKQIKSRIKNEKKTSK